MIELLNLTIALVIMLMPAPKHPGKGGIHLTKLQPNRTIYPAYRKHANLPASYWHDGPKRKPILD